MPRLLITAIFALAFATSKVWGFGSGAPATKCGLTGDLQPSHNVPVQTTTMPYTLTATSGQATYAPGESITLSIGGGQFKGFLIQAIDGSDDLVGTFVAQDTCSKGLRCDGGDLTGLTHTNKNEKTVCEFVWQAPSSDLGDITFEVTMVQDYATYWVQKRPLTLSVSSGTATGTTTTDEPTTTVTDSVTNTPLPQTTFVSPTDSATLTPSPAQGDRIIYDPECGSSKGCFVDCSGNDCAFMVTWRNLDSAVQFEMYAKPNPAHADVWVAVGFSHDSRMGDDSVTECVYSGGQVRAFNSYNQGYSNRKLDPAQQLGLANIYGQYINGVLYCTFTRQKGMPGQPEVFDLEQDWHIMFADGPALQVPSWHISMHSITDLPPASANLVDFQSFTVIGSAAKFPLVKVHGCMMIFAWVMFVGIGIVAARYYKNVWSDKTFIKLKIWFHIHRSCMIAALVLNCIAFIVIFVEVGGYSSIPDIPGKSYLRSHPVLGIIVTALCLANPIMAFFRPGPDSQHRPMFNWAHWGVGMLAYILSAICMCFGFQLGKSSTPDYAVYIMIVYVLYVIGFDVVFEVMECLNKKNKTAKVEGLEMTTRNGTDTPAVSNGNYHSKDKVKQSDKIKTMLLAVHIAFTGAFALVLALVVALN